MLKKFGIVTAMSTALLFGGAFSNTVDASANTDHNQNYQVQTYFKVFSYNNGEWTSNSDGNFNDIWQNFFANYQVNWNIDQPEKNNVEKEQPAKKQEAPKQEQPKQEQPKQEAPKQEAPKVEQPKQEAPEKVEAPAPAPQQPTQQPAEQPKQEASSNLDQLNEYEQQVVELTNQERVERGLNPLKVDLELSRVAREKSRDMAVNGYFSHNSPTYGSPFDMMKSYGIDYRTAGENIARGQRTPEEVVNAWMNSEGHRANILNASFTHIGVGYIADGNYWTQQFIGK